MSFSTTAASDTFITQKGGVLYDDSPLSASSVGSEASHSLATRLALKRQEVEEVDSELKSTLAEFERRMTTWKQREEALKERQRGFRESVLKYQAEQEKHESKIVIAMEKFDALRKQKEEQERQIQSEKIELERLKEEKRLKEEERDRLMCFQDYLLSVVDSSSGAFSQISDILTRYDTLAGTKKYLEDKMDSDRQEIDDLRMETSKYVQDQETAILVLNKEIARTQEELDRLRLEADSMESQVQRDRKSANEASSMLGQVRLALHNLYHRCRGRNAPSMMAQSLPQIIEYIGMRVSDLAYVVHSHKTSVSKKQSFVDGSELAPGREKEKAATTHSRTESPVASPIRDD
eukprot:TRINITY_DN2005_c0_g1_i1.p1 TRINITY_DN2005_c0_g1~~TRINITY_DN2005_c0_g1_i1.p1  ORF type:complete len:349 (+),score=105.40 TRINITY_DN2005_c0_g1_i1:102-1148(+)